MRTGWLSHITIYIACERWDVTYAISGVDDIKQAI